MIADFNATELMLRGMIKKVKTSGSLFAPSLRMVICIPSGSTNVEIRAVRDSAEHAGGREVYMIYEPMAAALGAGLDVEARTQRRGHRFVDHVDFAASGVLGRVAHGTYLDVGRSRRDADHHPQRGGEKAARGLDFLDHAAQHQLRGIEIGDHAVLQRPDRLDVRVGLSCIWRAWWPMATTLPVCTSRATIDGSSTTTLPL